MKTQLKLQHCCRCGIHLSRCEKLYLEGDLCALCDQIRSEALEIRSAPNPQPIRVKLVSA